MLPLKIFYTELLFLKEYSWGQWTEWSKCSKPCLEHANEDSIQERIRTCSPSDCTIGNKGIYNKLPK